MLGLIWEFFLRVEDNLERLKEVKKIQLRSDMMKNADLRKSVYRDVGQFLQADEQAEASDGGNNIQLHEGEGQREKSEIISKEKFDSVISTPSASILDLELEFYQGKFAVCHGESKATFRVRINTDKPWDEPLYPENSEGQERLSLESTRQRADFRKRDELQIGTRSFPR